MPGMSGQVDDTDKGLFARQLDRAGLEALLADDGMGRGLPMFRRRPAREKGAAVLGSLLSEAL